MRVVLLLCLATAMSAADLTETERTDLTKGLAAGTRELRVQAVMALQGKSGPQTLAALMECFSNQDWLVRETAVDFLAQQDPTEAGKQLGGLARDEDPRVRGAVLGALVTMQGRTALATLQQVVEDKHASVRRNLALALQRLPYEGDDKSYGRIHFGLLAKLAGDGEVAVRLAVIQSLAGLRESQKAERVLTTLCADEAEEVVFHAARVLADRDAKLRTTVLPLARNSDYRQRITAALALGEMGANPEVDPVLIALLQDPKWEVASAAAEALGLIGTTDDRRAKVEKALLDQLGHREFIMRASVAWALARIGSTTAVRGMISLLDKPDAEPILQILQDFTSRQDLTTVADWQAWMKEHQDALPVTPLVLAEVSDVDYYGIKDESRSVIFIVDSSGSMEENGKIIREREELVTAVDNLEFNTRFNVVNFNTNCFVWNVGPLRASWRNKCRLRAYTGYLKPEGATNIHGALSRALEQWGADTVYFLTDGMPTHGALLRPADIIQSITEANRDLRDPLSLHTIAFKVPEAQGFLQTLSKENGGQYRFIQ